MAEVRQGLPNCPGELKEENERFPSEECSYIVSEECGKLPEMVET